MQFMPLETDLNTHALLDSNNLTDESTQPPLLSPKL
jgi:hypothetical protein